MYICDERAGEETKSVEGGVKEVWVVPEIRSLYGPRRIGLMDGIVVVWVR